MNMELAGIKYTKDATGSNRYVRIDLRKHGENQLLEDFLDGMDALALKKEETITLEQFNRYIDNKMKSNV
jgi:hypothetical protein